jgi:hypothetical protein
MDAPSDRDRMAGTGFGLYKISIAKRRMQAPLCRPNPSITFPPHSDEHNHQPTLGPVRPVPHKARPTTPQLSPSGSHPSRCLILVRLNMSLRRVTRGVGVHVRVTQVLVWLDQIPDTLFEDFEFREAAFRLRIESARNSSKQLSAWLRLSRHA